MSDVKKQRTVRGHTCEGLEIQWKASHYGCIPEINWDGTFSGCDDTNEAAFKFCPYCGLELGGIIPEISEYVLERMVEADD